MTPISEQPLLKAQVLAKLLGLAGGVGEANLQQPAATDLWELHPRVGDYLFELNQTGAIHYEEVGEEGFAPIVICMTTAETLQHLAQSLVEVRKDKAAVEQRLQSLLRHDPDRLKQEIAESEQHISQARAQLGANPLLAPLNGPLQDIEAHFASIKRVAQNYDDIYRNILKPVQEEGKSGIRATVRWAVIGIVASWLVSNYKDILSFFRAFGGGG